jgi:hypothetical protein
MARVAKVGGAQALVKDLDLSAAGQRTHAQQQPAKPQLRE